MECDWLPFSVTGSDVIGNDTFLLRDVKGKHAWALLTSLDNFGNWALGGETESSVDWLTKKPYNLKATRCFMASKETKMYGKVMLVSETIEEEQYKFCQSIHRIVTFTDDNTDKKMAVEFPTVEYINEFRILETVDGTTVNRKCYGYKNHGAFPVFIEQWIEDENMAMVQSWSRKPIDNSKPSQDDLKASSSSTLSAALSFSVF